MYICICTYVYIVTVSLWTCMLIFDGFVLYTQRPVGRTHNGGSGTNHTRSTVESPERQTTIRRPNFLYLRAIV